MRSWSPTLEEHLCDDTLLCEHLRDDTLEDTFVMAYTWNFRPSFQGSAEH